MPEQSQASSLPPLRLHHFFGATAVAAIVLVGIKLMIDDQTSLGPLLDGPTAMVIVSQMIAAAALSLGLLWHRRGLAFPSEPGHGLLVVHTITVAHCLAIMALISQLLPVQSVETILSRTSLSTLEIVGGWSQTALQAALLAVYVWCFRRLADDRRWRVLFLFGIAQVFFDLFLDAAIGSINAWLRPQPAGVALTSTVEILTYPPSLTLTHAVLVVVAYQDWRTSTPRHWSHWLGVLVMVVLGAVAFAHAIALWMTS